MSVSKPFEENSLQNVTHILKNSNLNSQSLMGGRPAPVLPPRPNNSSGLNNSLMSYGGKNWISLLDLCTEYVI